MTLSEPTLAYIAGIIDGEGCVSLHRRYGHKRQCYATPSIQVTNTVKPLIDWLQATWGGQVYENREIRTNRKRSWHWFIAGEKARIVIRATMPYLWLKRAQAQIILDLHASRNGLGIIRGTRGQISAYPPEFHEITAQAVVAIRALNLRGPSPSSETCPGVQMSDLPLKFSQP